MHSFWVPALHGKVDLIPGHPNFIRIEASAPGNYQGQCAEYCGAEHAHMRLLVVAQEPDEYQAWRQQQLKPASEPESAQAKAGEQVFLAGPCSLCHQMRGTIAGGRVAPDLTHIASRQYIAANSFPNNDAYLEAWVTHAQSLKPEAQMPDLTQFSGEQLATWSPICASCSSQNPIEEHFMSAATQTLSRLVLPAALAAISLPCGAQSKPDCSGLPNAAQLAHLGAISRPAGQRRRTAAWGTRSGPRL